MKFINDKNIELILPKHASSKRMREWSESEKCFRLLVTEMLDTNVINTNIVDVGAYVGDNAIPWCYNYPNIIVYAIDPSTSNCEYIKFFAEANNITNIRIICRAISDKNQIISTNHSLNHCSFSVGNLGKTKVDSFTLDYLYLQNEIDNIGFLHLDVEGMEFNVVIGSNNIIKIFKPIITFEQHIKVESYKKICDHLKLNFGYITYMIPEICGARQDCRNFISVYRNHDRVKDIIGLFNKYNLTLQ